MAHTSTMPVHYFDPVGVRAFRRLTLSWLAFLLHPTILSKFGAEYGIRTRDLILGKDAFYR
jgi:hypothetical protein